MYRRVLAFDYDGTLAENGRVPLTLQSRLKQLHLLGYALFLVTGRQYETVELGELQDVFAGIVWENGAVLQHILSEEIYLPFGHLDTRLIKALERAGVPLDHGLAIVSTWVEHETTVWQVLSETGSDAVIVHNKGALMILPPGAAKGSGLERLLELCGFSPRNLVGFGDGENDLSLFQSSEMGIAVADAVASLKATADMITDLPGPSGVQATLEKYWLSNNPPPQTAVKHERLIALGKDEAGEIVSLPGSVLVSNNLGIFGDSSSGKSWVTGLLAEGMHVAGYQLLLIDPEGDFRGLRSLPGIIALHGDEHTLPTPSVIITLLEEVSISVVLDLCSYPIDKRDAYIADLFQRLRPLREHKFRPQWIVLEEAQHFLPPKGNNVSAVLIPMLEQGGWAFVSYRPDRLTESVLAALNRCLLARLSDEETLQTVANIINVPSAEHLANTPHEHIWLCGQKRLVRLRPSARRVPHGRHLYKYLDIPLPKEKRFYFHTKQGPLDLAAASLFEFKELIATLPLASLTYHQARGDFAAWVRKVLDDEVLATHLDKLAHRTDLVGEAMRQALLQRVMSRYVELHALR